MTIYNRKAISAVLAVFGFFAAGVITGKAQDRQDKRQDAQVRREQPTNTDLQDKADQQVSEKADNSGVVIPPPPNVTKRSPNTVLIPKKDAAEDGKYQEKPAAETGVKVGSHFGYRRDPFTGRAKFHAGLDIKAKWGDPVGASQVGTVQFAGWSHGYGNLIIVEHGGGVTTHYAHLSSFAVEVGQSVERGTVVGYAGSTGRATSPHLHYEVRVDGSPVDPLETVALDPGSDYFVRTAGSTVVVSTTPSPSTSAPVRGVNPATAPATSAPKPSQAPDQTTSLESHPSSLTASERPRRVTPAPPQ